MSELREDVRIITPGGELEGHLFVGADGLPELGVVMPTAHPVAFQGYYPWTFPATWTVCWQRGNSDDLLFNTWMAISELRQEIIDAQREAERETPEPEDDLTAAKRYQALEEE